MSTLLINASPKGKDSASGRLLDLFAQMIPGDTATAQVVTGTPPAELLQKLAASGCWVFFSPLYVDALPAHLLSCLLEISEACLPLPPTRVYGVLNCGLYEGEQTRWGLEVLSNWAACCGLTYGGGVGVGGGGALSSLPAAAHGPMAPVLKALEWLAGRVGREESTAETEFVTLALPRFLYKLAGEAGWRRDIRANGGRRKDLGCRRRPPREEAEQKGSRS